MDNIWLYIGIYMLGVLFLFPMAMEDAIVKWKRYLPYVSVIAWPVIFVLLVIAIIITVVYCIVETLQLGKD